MKNSSGFIYLIDGGNGLFKIGKTIDDPYARFKEIQNMSPVKLELLYQIDSNEIGQVEYMLHRIFDKQRAHGEWFKLTQEQVEKLMEIDPFALDYLSYDRLVVFMQNLDVDR